ncbi:prophage LambdaSa1 transcriptional regulator Cro/CI family [Firmicutes bacterium CAG:238]|nr:prophage LambdaSa1 transcriptional regulator Cro/CI family [Firmicutes bacterium CAG:238]
MSKSFNIKEIREKKGMTQEKLSQISGVSRAIIAGLESGARANTQTDTLLKIAKALEVEVSDIFLP